MHSCRRTRWNFALQYAADEARRRRVGLVVLEALRIDYPWASPRLHRFILEGMRENRQALGKRVFNYVERCPGEGRGLLEALTREACCVVTDDYPAFFLPDMVEAAGRKLDVSLVAVDGNGLLPMAAVDTAYPTAYAFRRQLQKLLPTQPGPEPLVDLPPPVPISDDIQARWPEPDLQDLDPWMPPGPPAVDLTGGPHAAEGRLKDFIRYHLSSYPENRNHPDEDAESRLSPYLHFGHISSHQILQAILDHEGVGTAGGHKVRAGARAGWWGLSAGSEAFLDQVVTWRELGFNRCHHVADYDRYDTLPGWARATLATHAADARETIYSIDQLAAAETYDPVWNAAQRQLLEEGRIHSYLRMLWGKKILQWTPSPQAALEVMIELNNRYALDGRDPNSYSGIMWVLGLFDRPWGPERPVFGTIRYMTSDSARRKLRMEEYLERWIK
jgi:deoxyribodipyrimidine photo-lyase